MALILIYEMLFARGIRKQYPLRDSIMRHKTRLQAELTKIKVKRRVRDNRDLIPEKIRKTLEQGL